MPPSRRANNPLFAAKIQQMALPLAPLVRLTTGEVHPSFPTTLLNFWLLTSEQLGDLAHFYHQRTPSVYTRHYPCPVHQEWRTDATLEEKRRRIGRFIGLRGCESPVEMKSEEEIGKDVRERRWGDEEDEIFKRKMRRY
ncbi:uncharacterized protein LY89DRAFT_776239 [Mollisia scopiformis]|uniref:Uncharacterized protein n=1 Tax=Mollisia scopiformis TaxID=149040 RepID=A0A194XWE3_MOLSC|nr:uncharacterized protein LY89DRAFT_776239 [Mollisia scopiformis]KUJ24047.1 hypothetical protein LY89DRAFT_776239 [Mollisia scopiformis]